MEPITTFFLSTIIGGIAGNRADYFAVETFNRIVKRLKTGKEPVNHDIEKAIRRSCLLATMVVCENVIKEENKKAGWKSIFVQNHTVEWSDHLKKSCKNEINNFNANNFEDQTPSFDPLILVDSNNPNNRVHLIELKKRLTAVFLEQIIEKNKNVPAVFLEYMTEGWTTKNTHHDWFTYLCAFFTEELKENKRLKNILDGQVLSKLSGLSINRDDFLNQLSLQSGEAIILIQELKNTLSTYGEKIDDFSNQIQHLANEQKELKGLFKRYAIRDHLSNSYAGREVAEKIQGRISKYQDQKFHGRSNTLEAINSFISKNTRGRILITSLAGYGKTAILSHWLKTIKSNQVFVCTHFFSQAFNRTSDFYTNILRQLFIYYELEGQFIPEQDDRKRDLIIGLLSEKGVKQNEGLVIVIDGLDEAETQLFSPFPIPCPNGMFIITSTRSGDNELADHIESWKSKETLTIHLEHLDKASLVKWVASAKFTNNLKLDEQQKVIDAIYENTKGYPLYLRHLIEELNHKKIKALTIDSFLQSIPDGFSNYVRQEFKHLAKSENIKKDKQIQLFFTLLTIAIHPLSEYDIENITDLTAWELSSLPWEITRWLDIKTNGDNLNEYTFAHPMLANEFKKVLGKQITAAENLLLDYCRKWRETSSNYIFLSYPHHLIEAGHNDELFSLLTGSKDWTDKKRSYFLTNNLIREDISRALTTIKKPYSEKSISKIFKLKIIQKLWEERSLNIEIDNTQLQTMASLGDTTEAIIIANSYNTESLRVSNLSIVLKGIYHKNGDTNRVSGLIQSILENWNQEISSNFTQIESLIKTAEELKDIEISSALHQVITKTIHNLYSKNDTATKPLTLTKIFQSNYAYGYIDEEFLINEAKKLYSHALKKDDNIDNTASLLPLTPAPKKLVESLRNKHLSSDEKNYQILDLISALYINENSWDKANETLDTIKTSKHFPLNAALSLIRKFENIKLVNLLRHNISHIDEAEFKVLLTELYKNESLDAIKKLAVEISETSYNFQSKLIPFFLDFTGLYPKGISNVNELMYDYKTHFRKVDSIKEKADILVERFLTLSIDIIRDTNTNDTLPDSFINFITSIPLLSIKHERHYLITTSIEILLEADRKEKALEFLSAAENKQLVFPHTYLAVINIFLNKGHYSTARDIYEKTTTTSVKTDTYSKYYSLITGALASACNKLGFNSLKEATLTSLKEYYSKNEKTIKKSERNIIDTFLLFLDNNYSITDNTKDILFPLYIEKCLINEEVELAMCDLKDHIKSLSKGTFEWSVMDKILASIIVIIKKTDSNEQFHYKEEALEITNYLLQVILNYFEESNSYLFIYQKKYFYQLYILCGDSESTCSLLLELFEKSALPFNSIDETELIDSLLNACITKGYLGEAQKLMDGLGWSSYYAIHHTFHTTSINHPFAHKTLSALRNFPLFENKQPFKDNNIEIFLDIISKQSLVSYIIYAFSFVSAEQTLLSQKAKKEFLTDVIQLVKSKNDDTWDSLFDALQKAKKENGDIPSTPPLNSSKTDRHETPLRVKAFVNFFIGDIYFKTQQFELAQSAYYDAYNYQQSTLYRFKKGISSYMNGRYVQAINDLKECTITDAFFWPSVKWLVLSFIKNRSFQEGLMYLDEISIKKPEHPIFFYLWKGYFNLWLSDPKATEAYIDKIYYTLEKSNEKDELTSAYVFLLHGMLELFSKNKEKSRYLFSKSLEYYKANGSTHEGIVIPSVISLTQFKELTSDSDTKNAATKISYYNQFINLINLRNYELYKLEIDLLNTITDKKNHPNNTHKNSVRGLEKSIPLDSYDCLSILLNLDLNNKDYLDLWIKDNFSNSRKLFSRTLISKQICINKLEFYSTSDIMQELSDSLLDEEAVVLASGTNHQGVPIYTYLRFPMRNFHSLSTAMRKGETFKPSDWGDVLYAGRGIPPLSLQLWMKSKYGLVDTPRPF